MIDHALLFLKSRDTSMVRGNQLPCQWSLLRMISVRLPQLWFWGWCGLSSRLAKTVLDSSTGRDWSGCQGLSLPFLKTTLLKVVWAVSQRIHLQLSSAKWDFCRGPEPRSWNPGLKKNLEPRTPRLLGALGELFPHLIPLLLYVYLLYSSFPAD